MHPCLEPDPLRTNSHTSTFDPFSFVSRTERTWKRSSSCEPLTSRYARKPRVSFSFLLSRSSFLCFGAFERRNPKKRVPFQRKSMYVSDEMGSIDVLSLSVFRGIVTFPIGSEPLFCHGSLRKGWTQNEAEREKDRRMKQIRSIRRSHVGSILWYVLIVFSLASFLGKEWKLVGYGKGGYDGVKGRDSTETTESTHSRHRRDSIGRQERQTAERSQPVPIPLPLRWPSSADRVPFRYEGHTEYQRPRPRCPNASSFVEDRLSARIPPFPRKRCFRSRERETEREGETHAIDRDTRTRT